MNTPAPHSRLPGWAIALLLTPFVMPLVMMLLLGVDVPYFDQWQYANTWFPPVIEGRWSFVHLNVQAGPHRLLFPTIWMDVLMLLTDWNTQCERLTSLFLAVVAYLGLVRALMNVWRRTDTPPSVWLLFIVAMLVASLHQWQNWLWGYQLQILMSLAALVWSLTLLDERTDDLRGLALPVMLAFVATFSFGTGIFVWPLGLAMIWMNCRHRVRVIRSTLWSFATCLAAALFLHGYRSTETTMSMTASQLATMLEGVGPFYAAPILGDELGLHAVLGWAALLGLAVLLCWCWKERRQCAGVLPLVAFACFPVLCFLLIGPFRMRWSVENALASRYVTLTNLLWIGILGLSYVAAQGMRERSPWPIRIWRLSSFVLVVSLVATSPASWRKGVGFRDHLLDTRERLITGRGVTPEWLVPPVNPSIPYPHFILARNYLLERRLSLFRDLSDAQRAPILDPQLSADTKPPPAVEDPR